MDFFSKLCFETCKENLHADHSLRSQEVNFTETTFYSSKGVRENSCLVQNLHTQPLNHSSNYLTLNFEFQSEGRF